MKKILLFDLDGTLTDPKEGITKCVQYALKYFGIEEELSKLLCFIGPPLVDSFREFYGFDEEKAKLAVEKYRERFKDIGIFENGVYDGIVELLELCKDMGFKIGLATSKPEEFAIRILDKYDLSKYFDEITGSTMDGSRNTKTEVIREAFLRMGITDDVKPHVVMIGDREHDIIGAKNCGIESIGVRFGYAEEGELEAAGADYIVDSVEALKGLLERLGK
ncbi:MAG: HAD-IA family hydrolase [Lachnospiraceae bacterium]|nr:HAD-IA family hydrolase [Lachnospiraceae bacterium]